MGVGEPFVGRRRELGLLRGRLAEAREGTGRLVLVTPPAGLGKTRLVEGLAARAGDVPVAWGAAVDDAGMPPLWPWERALRDLPGPREALTHSSRTGEGSADEVAAAEFVAQARVLDALEEQARATRGLLLVLEDLHWAEARPPGCSTGSPQSSAGCPCRPSQPSATPDGARSATLCRA